MWSTDVIFYLTSANSVRENIPIVCNIDLINYNAKRFIWLSSLSLNKALLRCLHNKEFKQHKLTICKLWSFETQKAIRASAPSPTCRLKYS